VKWYQNEEAKVVKDMANEKLEVGREKQRKAKDKKDKAKTRNGRNVKDKGPKNAPHVNKQRLQELAKKDK